MEKSKELFIQSNKNVLLLNVGGELIHATRSTLTYIPDTLLSSIFSSNSNKRSDLIEIDENGRIFLDISPTLFKYALEQLRRWKNRADVSANRTIRPPSWRVKSEFDEMLVLLGLGKYRQGKIA
jgi:hypothetical protein